MLRSQILVLAMALALPGLALAASHVPHQVCCRLVEGCSIEDINGRWGTTVVSALPERNIFLLNIEGVDDIEAFTREMSADPGILVAGANYEFQTPEAVREMVIAAVGGNWDDYQDQSLTMRIGLAEAHEISRGGGIVIAVLDTGIDPDHIAFAGRLSSLGYDFIDDDADPRETANGLDEDEDGAVDEGFAHGTMVAGIVALIAPEATILPIRVLDDEGRGTVYGVIRGILYAMEQGADVYNMSFGAPAEVTVLWPEIEEAAAGGAILVAGAGNEGREYPPYYPACDPNVCMVTAVDSLDVKSAFADFNDAVMLSAPGERVRSAYPGGAWGIGSGCSFAAPFVSGEAALVLSLVRLHDEDEDGWREEASERIEEATLDIYGIAANEPFADLLGEGRILLPEALRDLAAAVDGPAPRLDLHAWPNPAAGSVHLRLDSGFAMSDRAKIAIVDVNGRIVRVLDTAGKSDCLWDGCDDSGRPVSSGLYWARLRNASGGAEIPLRRVR